MAEILEIVIDSSGAVRGGRIVKRELGEVTQEAAKTDRSMRNLEKSTRRLDGSSVVLDRTLKRVKSTFRDLAVTTAAGLGIASVVTAMYNAVRAATQYQSALSNLSAITGATGKDLEYLSDRALEISKNSRTSARDVVEAFKLIGSAKPELLQSGAALAEVTKQAVTLAEAAQIDLASAANALTTSLNQYGQSADQAARFTNVLAAASQLGSAEVAPLAVGISKAGAAASGAGVGFEELAATLGILAKSGIPMETLATSLRNILIRLQTGADKTNPAVVGLTQAIRNLSTENLSVAETTKRFGAENFSTVESLKRMNGEIIALIPNITDTNTAIEQQATNNNNLQSSLDRLLRSFENFYIVVIDKSETLKNAIGGIADGINDVTTAYANARRAIISDIEAIETAHSKRWDAISLAFSGFPTILEAVAKSMRQAFEFLGLGFLGSSISDYGNAVIDMFRQIAGAVGDLVNETVVGMDHMDMAMQQRSRALGELGRLRGTPPQSGDGSGGGTGGGGSGGGGGSVPDLTKDYEALRLSLDAAYAAEQQYAEGQKLINANAEKGTELYDRLHKLLKEKYNVAMLEAAEAAKTTMGRVYDQVNALNDQAAALKISEREFRVVTTMQKLMAQDLTLSAVKAREFAEALVTANDALAAQRKAIEDRSAAAKAAQDDLAKQAEENERLLQQPFLNAIDGIQGAFKDAFREILDGGVTSFKDFGNTILSIMKDVIAEIAALMIFRPVVGGVLSSVGGGGIAQQLGIPAGGSIFGSGSSVAGNTTAAGGTSGGFAAANQGSGFNYSGAFGGALAGAGIGYGVGSVGGLNTTGSTIGGAAGGAVGTVIAPGIGTVIGSVAGSIIGGVIGNLLGGGGKDQQFSIATARQGSQGALDASGHFLFEGNRTRRSPFGTIGLLNADTSGTKGKLDDAILDTVLSFDEAIASVLDIRQTQIVARFLQRAQDGATQHASSAGEGDIGRALKDRLQLIAEGLIGRPLQGLADQLAQINDRDVGKIQSEGQRMIDIIALFSDGFERGLLAITGGLSPIQQQIFNLQEAAKASAKGLLETIEEIREAVSLLSPDSTERQQSRQAIRQLALRSIGLGQGADEKELTGAALALREMTIRIKEMRPVLIEAGFTAEQATAKIQKALEKARRELRQDFNASIRNQILAIRDPFKAALRELEEIQRQRIKDAKKLGGDLLAVERLNRLERIELEKQYLNQSVGQLRDFVRDLKTGDLSTLSQRQQAQVAGTNFNRVARQALNGNLDVGEFTSAARTYLEEQRALYGSSAAYQEAFKKVLAISKQLGVDIRQDVEDRRAEDLRRDIKDQAELDRRDRGEWMARQIDELRKTQKTEESILEAIVDLKRVLEERGQEDVA